MSSVVISGDTSGAITLAAPAVSGTNTATLPAATGTVMVSGNMPAFMAYLNANQTIGSSTFSTVQFNTEVWDTAGSYNNTGSTVTLNGLSVPAWSFMPKVAGYYQLNCNVDFEASTSPTRVLMNIFQGGTNGYSPRLQDLQSSVPFSGATSGSSLYYFDGVTNYANVSIYIIGTTGVISGGAGSAITTFSGSLIRAA